MEKVHLGISEWRLKEAESDEWVPVDLPGEIP